MSNATPKHYASDCEPAGVMPRMELPELNPSDSPSAKLAEFARLVGFIDERSRGWVDFYREVFGADGIARRLFPEPGEREFYLNESSELDVALQMLAVRRSTDRLKSNAAEPERMITVRLPRSLHESLKVEARESRTSINMLCITKLTQRVRSRFVPAMSESPRGRRPGPQLITPHETYSAPNATREEEPK
tara:strand:+ start:6606 stop:7178 length:573 start_codon:yes stop_codon:yes gene_type:complete